MMWYLLNFFPTVRSNIFSQVYSDGA